MHAVRRTAFYLTGLSRIAWSSMPTWLGAYRKTLAEGGSEEAAVRAGDRAVRLSQGRAARKTRRRCSGTPRLSEVGHDVLHAVFRPLRAHAGCRAFHPRVRDLPRLVARSIGLVILPAVLGELLAGRPPDDDEDPVAWAARKALLYPAASIPIFP